MLNKAILMGRLTRDPELRYTPNNVPTCSFSIAIDRRFQRQGEEKQTDFINCVAWRQTAEFISKYFAKGRMIAIVGSIQTRNWVDKEGRKQYVTEVVVDEASFTGEAKTGESGGGYTPSNNREQKPSAPATPEAFTPIDFDEGELPF